MIRSRWADTSSLGTLTSIDPTDEPAPFTALIWQVVGLPKSIDLNVKYEERWLGE